MAEALQQALTGTWRDPVQPAAVRAADLMTRMTVAEKIGQLGSFWAESARPGEQVAPQPDGGRKLRDAPHIPQTPGAPREVTTRCLDTGGPSALPSRCGTWKG